MNLQSIVIDEQKTFDGVSFPLVLSPEPGSSSELDGFLNWVNAHAQDLKAQLKDHGAIC